MLRLPRLASTILFLVLAACASPPTQPPTSRPATTPTPVDVAALVADWEPAPSGFGVPKAPTSFASEETAAWRRGVDTVGLLLAPAQTHPVTLRGDAAPVTSLAKGWLAEHLRAELEPSRGLRALVWVTRFPANVGVAEKPRITGRWVVAEPLDGTVTWEGSFAYSVEREGEQTWVIIHRRVTAERCDPTGCNAIGSRANARGVDVCASHAASAFVPSFKPLTEDDVTAGPERSDGPDVEEVIAECTACSA